MASVIPFNYTNMQNSLGMQIGMDTNNKYAQNLKDQGENLGNALASVGSAIKTNQTNNAILNATDANGNVNSNTLFQQLSQTDPQAALAMKQNLDQNTLANAKTQSEIARNNAQQRAQQAVQTMNNMKIASGVLTQFNQQLANSTPETWDATVQQAQKLASHYGLQDALPDNFTEGYSDQKKQLAMNAALSYKDKLDQEQQDFKNKLDSGKYFLDASNTANQIANRNASTDIQQQNADTSAMNAKTSQQNADTNQQRLSNDQQKATNQAIANRQKSYSLDVEKFNKAKADFVDQRNTTNTNLGTINTSLDALQQARQMLANNPNLAGSSRAKLGNSWVNMFGGNNQYSNFTNLLNQGISQQVLEIMSGQKGPQTDKDADRIKDATITNSMTTDPKLVLQSLDSLISRMNNSAKGQQQKLDAGLSNLKNLQNSFTQKYSNNQAQDTSNMQDSSGDGQ